MKNKIRIICIILASFTLKTKGQEIQCLFNPYNKIGSNYFFSTYWDGSSSFLIERRENEKANIITLINYGVSKIFTLYNDGDIEFYNGRGDWSQPDMMYYPDMYWD